MVRVRAALCDALASEIVATRCKDVAALHIFLLSVKPTTFGELERCSVKGNCGWI